MNRKVFYVIITFIVILIAGSSFSRETNHKYPEILIQDTLKKYSDGIFEGKSRPFYTDEPYWGIATITIRNGSFSEIRFIIRDSSLHEAFDEKYERHFEGNEVYIQQSRNDWKGVQTYPRKLAETQDIGKVDAVSGATWSYNIFKASIDEALKKSK